MCGIVGSFNFPAFDVGRGVELLAHRGPDANGVTASGPMIHGHTRLSLVDLSAASDQPFRFGNSTLSFNGEIWNWREVRAELEALGQRFRTSGDTEVLAAALEKWGLAAIERLEGMFAFAWSSGEEHFLVRDRFGKIPLYVHRSQDRWAWASERKAMPGLAAQALPAGHYIDLDSGDLRRWYTLPLDEPADDILPLLDAGVRTRLTADAPLCCLISGGVDSALILTLAKAAKPDVVAFTAFMDGAPSQDLDAARRLCAELEVRLIEVGVPAPTGKSLGAAARIIETPMKAQVEIAALCIPLAAAIRSEGFKACLSGEGADELFGGYGSMCIKGGKADDAGWRSIRVGQVDKMARGNFIRCNKAFMAHGVECRLPFLDRALVETVIGMTKAECPPGKGLLKAAAERAGVPRKIARRTKETFQGGAGFDLAAAAAVADPAAFYRAEVITAYGTSAAVRGQ